MNCQLARTNTYLSGQLKIDLTLNKNKGDLCVEDVHLSPVSSYTGFGWGDDPDDLLDGRHIENIKNFYSKTSNIFYEECLNPSLVSEYPIYSPNFVIDTHNNDNKMGLYRVPIKTYGKPYAFFCPFWITDPSKFLGTRFKFTFYKYINVNPLNDYMNEANAEANNTDYPEEKIRISSISLPMVDLEDKIVHNKFVKYFNEYLNGFTSHKYDIKANKFLTSNVVSNAFKLDVKMNTDEVHPIENNVNTVQNSAARKSTTVEFKPIGTLKQTTIDTIESIVKMPQKTTKIEEEIAKPFLSDDLVYLSFKENKGWVKGVDPQTGTYVNKDISYLCDTLLEKERPLMDDDYYLARIFKDNTVIAQQLVNFNFFFDIADIIPHIMYEDLQYCRFGIEVEIEQPIDDEGNFETLPLKDFYSNYEFIPNAYIVKDSNFIQITYDKNSLSEEDQNEIDEKYDTNALSYKRNTDFIQYVYKNKLEQNIFHWAIGSSNYIFNLYDGFTPIVVDRTREQGNRVYKSSGSVAFSPNIAIDKFDASQQTSLWNKMTSIGAISLTIRDNYPDYYTCFDINNEWIEGVKYDFSDIDYNNIFTELSRLGITTIDTIEDVDSYLKGKLWVRTVYNSSNNITFNVEDTGENTFIVINGNFNRAQGNTPDKSLSFVNVLSQLKDDLFPSDRPVLNIVTQKFIQKKPIELQQVKLTKLTKTPTPDKKFVKVTPIFKKKDFRELTIQLPVATPPSAETMAPQRIDTTNPVLKGKITSVGENITITEYGFEYTVFNESIEPIQPANIQLQISNSEILPDDPLIPFEFDNIIANTETEPSQYSIQNAQYGRRIEYKAYIKYDDNITHEQQLTIYSEPVTFEIMTAQQILDIKGKYFLYWFMRHALQPSTIQFNDTYNVRTAESPANDSTEVDFVTSKLKLLKKTTLYRYDGKLTPLFIIVDDKMPDEKDEKHTEKNLVNYSNYIVQYEESLQSIPAFNAYNNTKYLPEYPSVGYSSMASEVIDYDHSSPVQYYGDTSCNIYRGERKWYNGSFIYFLPRKISMTINSTEISDDVIYSGFVNEILNKMGLAEFEVDENDLPEEIEEYMRNNVDFVMNYVLPLYNYNSQWKIKYKENAEADNIPELDEETHQIIYTYDVTFDLI